MKHLSLVGIVLCCSIVMFAASGVVTVESPAANSTVTSSVHVNATYNGPATYMKLWVDRVAVISEHNANVFDYSATLADGLHLLEVQAHDATSSVTYTTPVYVTVTSSAALTIIPSRPSTFEGQSQQFTANAAVTWVASCGTIDSAGLFTAPTLAENCTITATQEGTATTATAIDHVTASVPGR
jgi:hypothetical protein